VTGGKADSDDRSQSLGSQFASAVSGRLVNGSMGSAVSMGMMPLQQSNDSVPKPVQVVSQIPLQTSNERMAKPIIQQLVQAISQPSVHHSGQASYQSVDQPSVQQPAQVNCQSVAQPSVQQPTQSGYQFGTPPSGLTFFKPKT